MTTQVITKTHTIFFIQNSFYCVETYKKPVFPHTQKSDVFPIFVVLVFFQTPLNIGLFNFLSLSQRTAGNPRLSHYMQ